MKAIELLELYRNGLLEREKIEIRKNNYTKKVVLFTDIEELKKEKLLQEEIDDWFVGGSITDGNIIINLKECE